jgi:type I restriction enzyme S subunit
VTDVPYGWALATVGEVADLTDGPFGSNLKTVHYTDTGPRVIRLQNIGDGIFRDEHAHVDQARYERLMKHAVRPGDIVAASLGESPPRACLVPEWLGPAIVKADCIRVRAHDGIDPGFLMWMLNSPPVRAEAASAIKGVGRPRLGLGGLRLLGVPVPPEMEQLRIVAAIEQDFSRIDAVEASLETLVGRFERGRGRIGALRRSILQLAFNGGLVARDPSDEPASSLLDRIANERPAPSKRSRRRTPAA